MAELDEATFSAEVGRRLRVVRRQRHWSLDDVERESGGRWSASAIGAYERGYRNLSLPRLQELAEFYGVSMSLLLGEASGAPRTSNGRRRVVLDLAALARTPEAQLIARYAEGIVAEREDRGAVVLSIRRDDVRALCSMTDLNEDQLLDRLTAWGVLATPGAKSAALAEVSAGDRAGAATGGDGDRPQPVIDLRTEEQRAFA